MTVQIPIGSIVAAGSAPSGAWKAASTPTKIAKIDGTSFYVGYSGSTPPAGTTQSDVSVGWGAPPAGATDMRPGDKIGLEDDQNSHDGPWVELFQNDG